MARVKDKERALHLRREGKSYSQIKEVLRVSKGTLSYWLKDLPLSKEQMSMLRDNNPKRIEGFRNTMRKKREGRYREAFLAAGKDIKEITKRELFISGLFLYWAEGTKVPGSATVSLSNTDPALLKFFLKWLSYLGVSKDKVRVRLHLYSDMNEKKEIEYWSKELKVLKSQFRKSYIKKTKLEEVAYQKGGHAHGTCNIIYGSSELCNYILQGIEYLRKEVE